MRFRYTSSEPDIKELITLEDAMEEMELGPNGGLLFCMEYLLENQSWFEEKLGELVGQDDYVLFDCPGQIELYSDQSIFREFVKILQNYGILL
jgi:GPN-loop GTPase